VSYQQKLFGAQQEVLTSDDWYTPEWIFETLGLKFDVDVASPPGGVSWIPATTYLTMADDGLSVNWTGRVWMNPPYSNPKPWVIKFLEHGDGIALLPTSNGAWHQILWESEADWVALPPMRFQSPTKGLAKGTIPTRCWLVGMGYKDELSRFGKVR
jgi:hypothetical protein